MSEGKVRAIKIFPADGAGRQMLVTIDTPAGRRRRKLRVKVGGKIAESLEEAGLLATSSIANQH